MRTIRASEISSYLYCQRAWWYRKQGFESQNQKNLAGGVKLHNTHGRKVLVTGFQRALAYGLVLIALVLLTIYLTGLVL